MELRATLVDELVDHYADEVGEQAFAAEQEQLEELSAAFDNGEWTVDDVEWIVSDWKQEAFPDAFSDFDDNTTGEIKDAIQQAIQRQSITCKLEALRSLKGVEIPVASSILLFMKPDCYPVLDKRAWRTLYETGYVYDSDFENDSIEDYLVYLGTCRALANDLGVDLRTLDRALWVLGR